jgi:hypothetical protein
MSHARYIKDELEPLLTDLASCFANQTNGNPAMSVRTTEMIRQAYVTICAYRLELESSSSLLCQQQLAADEIVEECARIADLCVYYWYEGHKGNAKNAAEEIRALKGKFSAQQKLAAERPAAKLSFGDGDYSCASCGLGMKEPCEHWKEFLSAQPNGGLTEEIRTTITHVLQNDLLNAQDNVARAKMQQKRMPFDHDNNDALVRYEEWARKSAAALNAALSGPRTAEGRKGK